MVQSLRDLGRVLGATWPALLAWYLAGTLVHSTVIAIAAPIGPQSALAALLLVPIAVLAKLVSYVGMFLAARRAMRGYRQLADGDVEFVSLRDAVGEFGRVLVASILPFFTLYALVGLVAEDLSAYARSAFRYSLGSETGVLEVGDGPLVVVVIVVAFAGRMLLKTFGHRLPRWVAIIEIYLEATWIFVALSGINAVFGTIVDWLANRQVVQWVTDGRELLRGLWEPVRIVIDGIDWLLPTTAQLLLLPLAWLLVAGVIYTQSLANSVHQRTIPRRLEATLRLRVLHLPTPLRRQARLFAEEWHDVGSPLVLSGRMILGAGAQRIAMLVVISGLLFAVGNWGTRALYLLIGPHDSLFWFTIDPLASLATAAIIEPVRIALLAVFFDLCLRGWTSRTTTMHVPVADRGAVTPREGRSAGSSAHR